MSRQVIVFLFGLTLKRCLNDSHEDVTPISTRSLETLVAACELAAEQEGLVDPPRDDPQGQPDIPFSLMPPFMDMTFDESLGSWPFAGLPLMQLDAMMTKPAKHHHRGKLPSAPASKGNDSASRNRRHKSKVGKLNLKDLCYHFRVSAVLFTCITILMFPTGYFPLGLHSSKQSGVPPDHLHGGEL